jgi:solute carrier family 25 S-adenosylmethionine transporter 26
MKMFFTLLVLTTAGLVSSKYMPTVSVRDKKIDLTKKTHQVPILASTTKKIELNALELCLCGAVSTMIGDFVMHPVDTIKIVQQTSIASVTFLAAASNIFKTKGVGGFFPGVAPYLSCDGISGAIKFASFEMSKRFVEARIPLKYFPVAQFVCAAGAMLACSLTLVPGEVLKIRLQSGLVKSLSSGISDILKTDGIKGFYAGYGATLVRDVPFTMLELGIYENLKTLLKLVQNKKELSPQEELAAAAFTGGTVAFITTPLDLIKTKVFT